MPLAKLASSLHTISESLEGGIRRVAVRPGERLNRDFVLRLSYGDEALAHSSLSVEPDPDGLGGTFALTLLPPTALAQSARPRDVIFLLDRSGSMEGWKIVVSRRACARMLDTLTDSDHFSVYAFDHRLEAPPAFEGMALVSASDRNRFAAIQYLANVAAQGGTELTHPLGVALHSFAPASAGRDRVLVLITDGQVGNEDQILRSLGAQLEGIRIFTVGVGNAVNAGFLRRLAVLGGGACELVESEARLDAAMDRLHRRIATPVISDLKIEPAGLELVPDTLVPARLPALFAGAPLVVTGRYAGPATEGGLTVGGTDAAGGVFLRTLAPTQTTGRAIAQSWARGRLRDLEDRLVTSKANVNWERQILDVSLRFNVLCRFTAFVAVDATENANPGGARQHIVQPVESPSDWDSHPNAGGVAAPANRPPAFYKRRRGTGPNAPAPTPAMTRSRHPTPQTIGASSTPPGESPLLPPALKSYRLRAAELIEQLKLATGEGPAEVLHTLRVNLVKLRELIEDLSSVGAEAEARQLDKLRAHLDSALAAPAPAGAEILSHIIRELTQFATAPVEADPRKGRRRWAFWR